MAPEPMSASPLFVTDTLVKGQPTRQECIDIGGQTYAIVRGPLVTVRLDDEWYGDVENPLAVIDLLRNNADVKADIFTFWQRLPDVEPRYPFYQELESIAALPVHTFDHWWNKQIKKTTRNMIRKSQKCGIEVRECTYNDDFVRGMTSIFNEARVRQGRPFWHYGKDVATVQRQFSRFLFREEMIGAYFNDELVGFAMLGNAGRFGELGQIISKLEHREKAVTNALIAKCVEVCAKKQLPYLVYAYWGEDSLSGFKRHSGFEEVRLPRYFVPLTAKGRAALKLGLHRDWKKMLPGYIERPLKQLRRRWHERREALRAR